MTKLLDKKRTLDVDVVNFEHHAYITHHQDLLDRASKKMMKKKRLKKKKGDLGLVE